MVGWACRAEFGVQLYAALALPRSQSSTDTTDQVTTSDGSSRYYRHGVAKMREAVAVLGGDSTPALDFLIELGDFKDTNSSDGLALQQGATLTRRPVAAGGTAPSDASLSESCHTSENPRD